MDQIIGQKVEIDVEETSAPFPSAAPERADLASDVSNDAPSAHSWAGPDTNSHVTDDGRYLYAPDRNLCMEIERWEKPKTSNDHIADGFPPLVTV